MRNKLWKLGLEGASSTFLALDGNKNRFVSLPRLKQFHLSAEEMKVPDSPKKNENEVISEKLKCVLDLSKPLDLSMRQEVTTQECILVVGTTGTGKSSTIEKVTGQKVRVGHNTADSCTKRCKTFKKIKDGEVVSVWGDTVGYDDTYKREDEDSFKAVLRHLAEERMLKVKAVVWTIGSQPKKDARLQRQADFINQFREGSIWNNDNVVILVKQPGSFNLEEAARGAMEAARYHCYSGEEEGIQVLGFTYLDSRMPGEVREKMLENIEMRQKMLLVTDDEVVHQVEEALDRIENSVQVVFEDAECEDCGEVGDKRLLPSYCHMEPMFRHPQTLRHFHPMGEPQPYHPVVQQENYHTGIVKLQGGASTNCETLKTLFAGSAAGMALLSKAAWFGVEPLSAAVFAALAGSTHLVCEKLKTPEIFAYTCCGLEQGHPGCKQRHACCKFSSSNPGCSYQYDCCRRSPPAEGCARRYPCCDKEEGATGCQMVCKKCGLEWGQPAGKCFKKDHHLKRLQDK